jgi:hypothetical protein
MTEPVPPFTRDELSHIAHDATPDIQRLVGRVADLENALYWVRFQATLHHLGGAFDPIHMWALSSLASDALSGIPLPDWNEAIERAQAAADKWVEKYADLVDEKDDDDDGSG